jgi:hypothetical protein
MSAPPRKILILGGFDGRFRLDVAIGLPLIGTIVHYRGWLIPE